MTSDMLSFSSPSFVTPCTTKPKAEQKQMTYFRRYELPPTSGSDSEVVIKLLSTTLDLWSPVFHSFLVPPWKKSKDTAIKKFYFSKIYALQFFNRYSPDCCLWLTIYSFPFSLNPVSQDDDENDNAELENPKR